MLVYRRWKALCKYVVRIAISQRGYVLRLGEKKEEQVNEQVIFRSYSTGTRILFEINFQAVVIGT